MSSLGTPPVSYPNIVSLLISYTFAGRLVPHLVSCFVHFRASTRKRLAAYLKWLEDKAGRRREYERYLAALAATRGAGGRYSEQVGWWEANEAFRSAAEIANARRMTRLRLRCEFSMPSWRLCELPSIA